MHADPVGRAAVDLAPAVPLGLDVCGEGLKGNRWGTGGELGVYRGY